MNEEGELSDALDFLESDDLVSWLLMNTNNPSHHHSTTTIPNSGVPVSGQNLPAPQIPTNPQVVSTESDVILDENGNIFIDPKAGPHTETFSFGHASTAASLEERYMSVSDQDSSSTKGRKRGITRNYSSEDFEGKSNSSGSNMSSSPSNTMLRGEPKRKKLIKVEELEARIKLVTSENEELASHLKTVQKRTIELQKSRAIMEKQMEGMVNTMKAREKQRKERALAEGLISEEEAITSSSSFLETNTSSGIDIRTPEEVREDEECSEKLNAIIKQYSSMYADYGDYRKKEVAFHLKQLEKLLVPTQTTKLCLWIMKQDETFFSTTTSPLFNIFCNEIGVTDEQTKKIQERREKIKELIGQLQESLNLIKILKSSIDEKHAKFDITCGVVRNIGTAKQIVSFLLWVQKNGEMLSHIIPDFWRGREKDTEKETEKEEDQSLADTLETDVSIADTTTPTTSL